LEKESTIRDCNEPADILDYDDENEEIEDEEIKEKKKLINDFFSTNDSNKEDPKYENIKDEINEFFVPNNEVINFLRNQIEKDILIKSFDSKNKEELLNLFIKDYNSQFISSLIESEDIYYNDILKYLIELRFGKKNEDSLLYFSKSILWSHIYKDEFIFLFRNFGIIKEKFPNLNFLEKVMQKIESNEINYLISNHQPKHKELINKPFLLILDSFFYCLLELIETLHSSKVLEIINSLSEIIQI
jgi:hypothetical protein